MGLFINKQKKLIKQNNHSKDLILNELHEALKLCNNADALESVTYCLSSLKKQTDSSSNAILAIDERIMLALRNAIKHLDARRWVAALSDLFDTEDMIMERNSHCESHDDIDNLNIFLNRLRKREEVLLRLHKEHPNDLSLTARISANTANYQRLSLLKSQNSTIH